MAVIQDTFTEASDTALASHTPDTGTSWSEALNSSAGYVQVNAANDYAESTVSENSCAIIMVANPAPGVADADVEVTLPGVETVSGTKDFYIIGRYQDTSNFYAIRLLPTTESNYAELLKVVSGSYTSLDTAEPGLAADDVWKLEMVGTAIKCHPSRHRRKKMAH